MDIVVFGAGSIGSLLGGLLSRVHDVTLIARPDHVELVNRNGLVIDGLQEWHVHPEARTEVAGLEADLALVTVKSYDCEVAARELSRASVDAVCSVQNGMGNEETLAEFLSDPVLGGTTTYGADRRAPGSVTMTGEGVVTLGLFHGGDRDLLMAIASAFDEAGINVETVDDIHTTLWRKLVVNAAINPVTALARCRNGAVADEPLASIARVAASETVAVAAETGIYLDEEAAIETVFDVARATADNRSSMLQDVLAERRTEIDAINATVVDRTEEVAVPVNATLSGLVVGWERTNELR